MKTTHPTTWLKSSEKKSGTGSKGWVSQVFCIFIFESEQATIKGPPRSAVNDEELVQSGEIDRLLQPGVIARLLQYGML